MHLERRASKPIRLLCVCRKLIHRRAEYIYARRYICYIYAVVFGGHVL